MTEATTPKKPGRPRKAVPPVVTTPQDSPVAESNPDSGTKAPAEPEIDVQRLHAIMARHMIRDHRMTWGEVRISLGYGGTDHDQAWGEILRRVQ